MDDRQFVIVIDLLPRLIVKVVFVVLVFFLVLLGGAGAAGGLTRGRRAGPEPLLSSLRKRNPGAPPMAPDPTPPRRWSPP